jgi:hypothetical protein
MGALHLVQCVASSLGIDAESVVFCTGFSVVRKACDRVTGLEVAIKVSFPQSAAHNLVGWDRVLD